MLAEAFESNDPQALSDTADVSAAAPSSSGLACRLMVLVFPAIILASYSPRIRSTASSRRASGVVSEIRKKPSPFGP